MTKLEQHERGKRIALNSFEPYTDGIASLMRQVGWTWYDVKEVRGADLMKGAARLIDSLRKNHADWTSSGGIKVRAEEGDDYISYEITFDLVALLSYRQRHEGTGCFEWSENLEIVEP